MVLLPSVGRYPDLLFGFLACRDGLHCCGRLRCCSSAITARQSRRAAQNAQAEGQCRSEQQRNEPFLDHGGFLLLSMPGAPPGEHFGSYF